MASLSKIFRPLAGVCSLLSIFVVASGAMADASNDPTNAPVVDPNAGFSSPDSGGGLFDDSSGPLDLIHRAVLMNDMTLSDFRQQQQGIITEEAANFRQLQREALRQQPSIPSSVDGPEESDPEAE